MAEFQEVMKQRKRMCGSVESCSKCGIGKRNEYCENFIIHNPQEAEEIIMNWAKEHPIVTNADKFKDVFGYDVTRHSCHRLDECNGVCKECEYNDFWNKEYKEPKEV